MIERSIVFTFSGGATLSVHATEEEAVRIFQAWNDYIGGGGREFLADTYADGKGDLRVRMSQLAGVSSLRTV